MDGCSRLNQKQRRGSNPVIDKSTKKSKRNKKNKVKKKSSDGVTGGCGSEENEPVVSLISNLHLNCNAGLDSNLQGISSHRDNIAKKISSSTSISSGTNDDLKVKESLSVSDVEKSKGKSSPLWLTDNVIKENFLRMADQASDFDESVWQSIKLTLSQKAYKSLSAKYKSNFQSIVSQFQHSLDEAESLRWEFIMDEPTQEQERLRVYKINRRKRYLAERHAKGLELVCSTSASNQSDALHQTMSSTYLDINDGPVLSQIINPFGYNGAEDREMVLHCI